MQLCSYDAAWPHNTSFVGNNYFCDSGWEGLEDSEHGDMNYAEDKLWDGIGCGASNTCCDFNGPPYFCKVLPQPTSDVLELRVCSSDNTGDIENTDVASYLIEIYVDQ